MNPYLGLLSNIESIKKDLVKVMCSCPMPIFKNVAAVYIVWQEESHQVMMAAQNWEMGK